MNVNFQQSCLLINKPSGISSNKVLTELKKKLNQKKAGFSGTLDPLASGLLIIFFNKATKLCSYFLDSDKRWHNQAKCQGFHVATLEKLCHFKSRTRLKQGQVWKKAIRSGSSQSRDNALLSAKRNFNTTKT